jgi:hypothetical protein
MNAVFIANAIGLAVLGIVVVRNMSNPVAGSR